MIHKSPLAYFIESMRKKRGALIVFLLVMTCSLMLIAGCTPIPTDPISLSLTPSVNLLNNGQTIVISVISEEWQSAELTWELLSEELESMGSLSPEFGPKTVFKAPEVGEGKVTVSVTGRIGDMAEDTASLEFIVIDPSSKPECESVTFGDDFSNINSGWEDRYDNDFDQSSNGYRDETYYFQANTAGAPMWSILGSEYDLDGSTVQVDANVQRGEGRFGLIMSFVGDPESILDAEFLLSTISTLERFEAEHHSSGSIQSFIWENVESQDPQNTIPITEGFHTLAVQTHNGVLKVFVDGKFITATGISGADKGNIGLYVEPSEGGTPFEVIFDNIQMCANYYE